MKTYVYYRVSTEKQDNQRQKNEVGKYLKENNIKVDAVFEDKASGKDFKREQYQALKRILEKGDCILIKELDRLGRNYEELKDEWKDLTRLGASIIVIDSPMLSTKNKSDLETTLITDIVFSLLAYTAQKEREKTQQRVKEGMVKAKLIGTRSGKAIGRPERTIPKDFDKYYLKWKKGNITAVEFAKLMGMSRQTLYRYINLKKLVIKAKWEATESPVSVLNKGIDVLIG